MSSRHHGSSNAGGHTGSKRQHGPPPSSYSRYTTGSRYDDLDSNVGPSDSISQVSQGSCRSSVSRYGGHAPPPPLGGPPSSYSTSSRSRRPSHSGGGGHSHSGGSRSGSRSQAPPPPSSYSTSTSSRSRAPSSYYQTPDDAALMRQPPQGAPSAYRSSTSSRRSFRAPPSSYTASVSGSSHASGRSSRSYAASEASDASTIRPYERGLVNPASVEYTLPDGRKGAVAAGYAQPGAYGYDYSGYYQAQPQAGGTQVTVVAHPGSRTTVNIGRGR